jgi:hypothetical protein
VAFGWAHQVFGNDKAMVGGEKAGLPDGYVGEEPAIRAEYVITVGRHCLFLFGCEILLSLVVGVEGAVLALLFEVGQEVNEAVHG